MLVDLEGVVGVCGWITVVGEVRYDGGPLVAGEGEGGFGRGEGWLGGGRCDLGVIVTRGGSHFGHSVDDLIEHFFVVVHGTIGVLSVISTGGRGGHGGGAFLESRRASLGSNALGAHHAAAAAAAVAVGGTFASAAGSSIDT